MGLALKRRRHTSSVVLERKEKEGISHSDKNFLKFKSKNCYFSV